MSTNKASSSRWFANDGGPMLILPGEAAPIWEGADPPAGDRTVQASFRWQGEGRATDYDLACDVQEPAALLAVGSSWGVVLRTDVAGSVGWLPVHGETATGSVHVAVGVEYTNDDRDEFYGRAYDAVSLESWTLLAPSAALSSGEFVLQHPASVGREVSRGTTRPDGLAVIGDSLVEPAAPGMYAIEWHETTLPDAHLVFIRFRHVAADATG